MVCCAPPREREKKNSKLNQWLSNIVAIPHVSFGIDRIYQRGKKDQQGTFVRKRMWNKKNQAHKRRTELIHTCPPWWLRMSYSSDFLWLRSKSVASKWLYLGLSHRFLTRLPPFLSVWNRVRRNYTIDGHFLIVLWKCLPSEPICCHERRFLSD